MKNIIARLQSTFIATSFYDKVNGKAVNIYERRDGTRFMAHSKWGSIFFFVNQSVYDENVAL